MAYVRTWRPADLPYLTRMTAITTWEITPEDDKAHTSFATVANNAAGNLQGVLTSPGGTAFVADEGGVPVGYLLVAVQPHHVTGEPRGYLADIYVLPQFRRKGLSKELHRHAYDYLRRLGIRKVTNWTHTHNRVGQSTITHHGHETSYVMMAKELTPPKQSPAAVRTPQVALRQ